MPLQTVTLAASLTDIASSATPGRVEIRALTVDGTLRDASTGQILLRPAVYKAGSDGVVRIPGVPVMPQANLAPVGARLRITTTYPGQRQPVVMDVDTIPASAVDVQISTLSPARALPDLSWTEQQIRDAVRDAQAAGALALATNPLPVSAARIRSLKTGGTTPLKILCVGDSTTAGQGGSTADRWTSILRDRLGWVVPVQNGMIGSQDPTFDTRWSAGSGWQRPYLTSYWEATTSGAGDLSYTVAQASDTADVYTMRAAGRGTVVIQVDGVTKATVNLATGTGVQKTTLTYAKKTGAVVTVKAPTGGSAQVAGIDAYDATKPGVRVGNVGVGGSTTGSWGDTNGGDFWQLPMIRGYAPDLTLISLGINDAGWDVTTGNYRAYLTKIVTAAQVSGEVMVMSPFPVHPQDARVAELEAYTTVAREVAAAAGAPFLDVQHGVTWAAVDWLDALHPDASGYARLGHFIHAGLTAALGPSSLTGATGATGATGELTKAAADGYYMPKNDRPPLTGTGSPEGAVSAFAGTRYVDKNKTLGALEWIKYDNNPPDYLTGWRVTSGDTGWRDVRGLLINGWTATEVNLRRLGDQLSIVVNGLNASAATSGAFLDGAALVAGMRFDIPPGNAPVLILKQGSTTTVRHFTMAATGALAAWGYQASDTNLNGLVTMPCSGTWPSTLPGVAS